MIIHVGEHLLAWVRETSFSVPRLWIILACVVGTWLIVGLIVLGVYKLAT